MKKVISFTLAVIVLAVSFIPLKVYATDDPSPTPSAMPNPYSHKIFIQEDGSIDPDDLMRAFSNLTNDQQGIVCYLTGQSNYMYMGARGFYYNVQESADLTEYFDQFGKLFWYENGNVSLKYISRTDTYMQRLLASFITYARGINDSFDDWLDGLAASPLYIPYTNKLLTSWNNYYSDNSVLGVQNFGQYNENWVSGSYLDFAFGTNEWYQNNLSAYTNFMINNSPVLYGPRINDKQMIISLQNIEPVNALYILKSYDNEHYYEYRFGYDYGLSQYQSVDVISGMCYLNQYNKIVFSNSLRLMNCSIQNSGTIMLINDFLWYVFYKGPFNTGNSTDDDYFKLTTNCYPLIEHVYIVDDLNTLEGKVEIFDVHDIGVLGGNDDYIIEPIEDDLYYQVEPTLVTPDMWDILVDENGDPADPDSVKPMIIKINPPDGDYTVAPGEKIVIPEDWLESDGNYLDFTNNTALPFFVFVGDVFNSLGVIRIFVIAVLILGLAGGVLVKFLL